MSRRIGRTRCSVPPAALAVRQRPEILSAPHLYRLVIGADTPNARHPNQGRFGSTGNGHSSRVQTLVTTF